MTQDQLEELERMPLPDRIRKYRPLLQEGKINLKQYQYVIWLGREHQALDHRKVTSETFVQALGGVDSTELSTEIIGGEPGENTTSHGYANPQREDKKNDCSTTNRDLGLHRRTNHPSRSTGNSQKALILELLSDGRPHSTVEIMGYAYKIRDEKAGNCRIPSRIDDLRQEGYIIPKAQKVKGRGQGVFAYILKGKQDAPYKVTDRFEEIGANLMSG